MLFSATAKDTFILFIGNISSSFWGFLFTLFAARSMSVYDFGIFSAVLNLVVILASLTDLGISSGATSFISGHLARGESEKADEYIKSSFVIRLVITLVISVLIVILAPFISTKLLASDDPKMAIWSAVLPIFLFPDMFFPSVLRAKNKFLQSTVIDNAFYLTRFLFALVFYLIGGLTISRAFWAFGAGFVVEMVLIFYLSKFSFLKARPQKEEYKKLARFSGWLGVNSIVSSISGRIDVQMIAAMLGATATGIFSIPSRLTGFITILTGSFSSVLAPRLAGFGNKENEKKYILKSTVSIVPLIVGIVIWIIIAKPFILLLFGDKYLPSVPVFQVLAGSLIPALFTIPSVTAIIYSMKKTIYIGVSSFFQTGVIVILNLLLIPKFGLYGPAITSGITNTLFAIYTWIVVYKYYWGKSN